MPKKRLVVLSDFHCGSVYGLTRAGWFNRNGTEDEKSDLLAVQTAPERKACWNWFAKEIEALRPINRLLLNGDLVEGKAPRQGALELLTADPDEQVKLAKRVVEFVDADEVAVIFGTAYHTGEGMDYERAIAEAFGAPIGGQDYFEINGVIFDFKHHISSSTVPHGRHTALSRERVWNLLWADREEFPKADVIIRSHVHYHVVAGGTDWLAMTTPALQSPGTRYGVRRMSGLVDYGFVVFDIQESGEFVYGPHLLRGRKAPWAQKPVAW